MITTTDTISSLSTKQLKCSSYGYDSVNEIKAEEAKLDKALDLKTVAIWGLQKCESSLGERKSVGFCSLFKMGPAIFYELDQH